MWCQGLNPLVKLHVLHGSVVPAGVTVLLGLCNPPRRGRGEPAKPELLYPLVWIPCCDTVSEKLGSQSRVGIIAGDLESRIMCSLQQNTFVVSIGKVSLLSALQADTIYTT
jgi:hypothetical protein